MVSDSRQISFTIKEFQRSISFPQFLSKRKIQLMMVDTMKNEINSFGIVILGMHRSGTSALAGLLNKSGVNLGKNLLPPMTNVNEKGFFENERIVLADEKILNLIGFHWLDPRHIPEHIWIDGRFSMVAREIEEIIQEELLNSPCWGIKDPRICRLLPLYKKIFSKIKIDPCYVLIFRHPDEVSSSIHKRDGIDDEAVYISWLWHVLDAEFYTKNNKRGYVLYEDLLIDPQKVLLDLQKTLSIEFSVESFPNGFIQKSYQHINIKKNNKYRSSSKFRDLAIYLYEGLVQKKDSIFDEARNIFLKEIKVQSQFLLYISKISSYQEKITHLEEEIKNEKLDSTQQTYHRDAIILELEEKIRELEEENFNLKKISLISFLKGKIFNNFK